MTRITKWFIVILTLVVIAYDAVAYYLGGTDATISKVTLNWARDMPVLVFGIGFLLGHLIWPQKVK